MLSAAECFHGHDAALEQEALIKAFEYTLPAERFAQGLTLSELGPGCARGPSCGRGRRAPSCAASARTSCCRTTRRSRSCARRWRRSSTSTRRRAAALRRHERGADDGAVGRRRPARCLERTAAAARDAGALQLLDTTLWIHVPGRAPRRHAAARASYIEQVRELRRAIGYDAEHVINVALSPGRGPPGSR